jgi:hypothetical protein
MKALLKQAVNVSTDYNGLGTQIQIFTAASNIFFGNKSICTTNLQKLLLLIIRNKKSFRDQITLNEFFTAKFLFTVVRRVQQWLCMCEQGFHTSAEVNDQVLQFKDLIDEVLNVTFHLILPSTVKKVQGTISIADNKNGKPKKGGGKDGDKKHKNIQSNGNLVKNTGQPDEFKVANRET